MQSTQSIHLNDTKRKSKTCRMLWRVQCGHCRSSTRRTWKRWSRDCRPSTRLSGIRSTSPTKRRQTSAKLCYKSRFAPFHTHLSFTSYCWMHINLLVILRDVIEVFCMCLEKMEQLEVSHDAMKLELEHSHEEQLQCVKQQHEWSLEGEWVESCISFHLEFDTKYSTWANWFHWIFTLFFFFVLQRSTKSTLSNCSLWTQVWRIQKRHSL